MNVSAVAVRSDSKLVHSLFAFLLFLIGVILFGAYVRATGSGAGCGDHWPLCQGTIVPVAPSVKTMIEFTHRITSGLTLPLAFLLWLSARRTFDRTHPTRRYMIWTIGLLITEALVGAGLVLFEHVAESKSVFRAISISVHLINTFFLMYAATLSWHWARFGVPAASPRKNMDLWIGLGIVGLVLTGVTGALTALGDTLFPVTLPGEALERATLLSAHLFERLRVFHPFVATGVACYVLGFAFAISAPGLVAVVLLQVALGFTNIYLSAPVWMQLLHLFMAYAVWMKFIITFTTYRYNLIGARGQT